MKRLLADAVCSLMVPSVIGHGAFLYALQGLTC